MGSCTNRKRRCEKCGQSPQLKEAHTCSPMLKLSSMIPDVTLKPLSQKSLIPSEEVLKLRYGATCVKNSEQISVKIYSSADKITTKLVSENLWKFPPSITETPSKQMRTRSFQEKLQWFRLKLEKHRISWMQGCEWLVVDRQNILMTTKTGLEKKDLHKELKIKFSDEKVEDAGGLLREWMHLTVKEIFDPEQNGNLLLCDSDEVAYRFRTGQNPNEQEVGEEIFRTLGIIIGKALLEKVSLNCFLDRTIWRIVCNQPIQLEDIASFDRELYRNWCNLMAKPGVEKWDLDFTVIEKDEHDFPVMKELVSGGSKIRVTDRNKTEYLQKLIKWTCVTGCESYIEVLRNNIYKTIPIDYLEIFEPLEFQMMLNGPTIINVSDWKKYTVYKGYLPTDTIILWFWKRLANLLHYTTGSNRVPVRGFKYLESNRNQICPFQIEKIAYRKENPYPIGHTCFNRLSLPTYAQFEELKANMDVILKNQLTTFGED